MMLGADDIKRRVSQLENYLNAALQYDEYRNHSAMVRTNSPHKLWSQINHSNLEKSLTLFFFQLEFLEVSEFSFVRDLVCKTKEGMVR